MLGMLAAVSPLDDVTLRKRVSGFLVEILDGVSSTLSLVPALAGPNRFGLSRISSGAVAKATVGWRIAGACPSMANDGLSLKTSD
jgi:hypothetical protein